KIKFIDTKLMSLQLAVDGSAQLSGNISLSASLSEDYSINNLVTLKQGLSGEFGFSYDNSNSFKGSFDFSGIQNINLELIKSDQLIASLKNGSLDPDGMLSGTMTAAEGEITYQNQGFAISIDKLNTDVELSMQNGFKIKTGNGQITVADIQGMDGSLSLALKFNEGLINTEVSSSNLSGYGFQFSNTNIRADIDANLDLIKILGSLEVRHDEFSASISITDFEITEGQLKSFNGVGQVEYLSNTVNVTGIKYDENDQLLSLDANVEVETNGVKVAAEVNEFTINKAGEITFGDYDVNVSGTLHFGPLVVTLKEEHNKIGNYSGGGWKLYETEASFYLKLKDAAGYENDVAITNAKLKYAKHKRRDEYKNIALTVSDANIPLGELYMIEAAINEIDLAIETDAEYLTASEADPSDVNISSSSRVALEAQLTQDKNLSDLIVLRKGVNGSFAFNFTTGKEFEGSFDFEGIENLHLALVKNNRELASLEDGKLDQEGNFSGKLISKEGASYSSGAFTVGIENLDLDVTFNLIEGAESFRVLEGKGSVFIKEIKGIEGQLKVALDYDPTGNFNAEVLNDQTSLTAFGLSMDELNLKSEFSPNLDLIRIEGSLKASHHALSGKLDVPVFKIEDGALQELQVNGLVNYNGFTFELLESSYTNNSLNISAKVEIENAGKLTVDKFKIDRGGNISVGKIEGELNKPLVSMHFDATFQENGFKGSFNGGVKFVKLDGDIAFGSEQNFNYAYLRMAVEGKSGIALGPTGLQLTKLGGRVGYNYYLDFSGGQFLGNPRKNNYLLGLTLGVSDVANMFAAEGTTVVQFGDEKLQLSLLGNLKAPRSNPIINSDFKVNYYLPANTVDGSLSTDISIPSNSGFVFETTTPATVNFAMANDEWNVEGGVRAAMFREITFTGNTSLSRKDDWAEGYLNGQASYHYYKSFEYNWTVADLSGELELGFNSHINAHINPNGFNGSFGVHIYGNGSLEVTTVVGSVYGSASLDCQANVSYRNNKGEIEGNASVAIQSTLVDFERSIEINKTF
ncbi:MAG: hypothetical protein R3345_11100, partial [Fulvivirga sp.]|nr:hypothetical protein [Fulvivirga sp.]